MTRFVLRVVIIAVIGALATLPAASCQFHTNLPTYSITDRLRSADRIILARDDGRRGFVPVEILRGEPHNIEIPYIVDSITFRRLQLNEADRVLFAHDPELGKWQRLAYVDSAIAPILTELMNAMPDWSTEYDEARFQFFAELHDHADENIRKMAHLELDKAPYQLLRTLDLRLDAKDLISGMWRLPETAWVPFKYLLLGISDDEAAIVELDRAIRSADGSPIANYLGPVATALIEVDGVDGVIELAHRFLRDPDEPLQKIRQVVQAMAIHHEIGDAELRDRIKIQLSHLLQNRPKAAAIVARELANKKIWSQANSMRSLLDSNTVSSFYDRYTISTYLALAEQASHTN